MEKRKRNNYLILTIIIILTFAVGYAIGDTAQKPVVGHDAKDILIKDNSGRVLGSASEFLDDVVGEVRTLKTDVTQLKASVATSGKTDREMVYELARLVGGSNSNNIISQLHTFEGTARISGTGFRYIDSALLRNFIGIYVNSNVPLDACIVKAKTGANYEPSFDLNLGPTQTANGVEYQMFGKWDQLKFENNILFDGTRPVASTSTGDFTVTLMCRTQGSIDFNLQTKTKVNWKLVSR